MMRAIDPAFWRAIAAAWHNAASEEDLGRARVLAEKLSGVAAKALEQHQTRAKIPTLLDALLAPDDEEDDWT